MNKRIKLISATIRPDVYVHNYSKWMDSATDITRIDGIVAVNTEEQKKQIENKLPNVEVIAIGENIGVCKPIYEITKDLKGEEDDIIIAFFDDVMCIPNWDGYLYEKFVDYTGALFINDGVQNPNCTNVNILIAITMPVLDYRTLLKLNKIIFHPSYKHYYGDNEVYTNLLEMGLLKDIRKEDKTTFLHKHYNKINKQFADDFDQLVVDTCSGTDRCIYDERMRMSLEERIKL